MWKRRKRCCNNDVLLPDGATAYPAYNNLTRRPDKTRQRRHPAFLINGIPSTARR
ncbi:hypothetical protein CKO_00494 [Citrobacter koseri ATCC BAA-895]|uniref:Uncharacterized protein n=1 Tax=Citrobacter koseri (strain ATCC BAA-895 / CDC 4225-83 / SGSC4696) TaxID=290338 RepID=A8ADT7_CITK8|nr:hypothetical protein CKO_00494 [Citrobacter koseri ATCC BAA-895]